MMVAAQNNVVPGQFDPNNHPSSFQMMNTGGPPMNGPTTGGGPPPQRQPSLSEANNYAMMQGGGPQMMTAHGHPQQMQSYMTATGQMIQHRPQIGFGGQQQVPPPQQVLFWICEKSYFF